MFACVPSSLLKQPFIAENPPKAEESNSRVSQAVEGHFVNLATVRSNTAPKTEAEYFQQLLWILQKNLEPYSFLDSLLQLKQQGAHFQVLNFQGNDYLQNKHLLAILSVWEDDIEAVSLFGCEQISIDLKLFANLPKLGDLNIQDTNITGHITSLSPLTKLWRLNLDNTRVEGASFSHGIPSLIFICWNRKKPKAVPLSARLSPDGLYLLADTPAFQERSRQIASPVSFITTPRAPLNPIKEEPHLLKPLPK